MTPTPPPLADSPRGRSRDADGAVTEQGNSRCPAPSALRGRTRFDLMRTRHALGWTQQQLADAAGYKRTSVAHIECGHDPFSRRAQLRLFGAMWHAVMSAVNEGLSMEVAA